MSVVKFCQRLHDSKYGKNDRKWFPKWIRRYAPNNRLQSGGLSVSKEAVIEFSQSLRDAGTPAWQRLQASSFSFASDTRDIQSGARHVVQ